MGRTAIKSGRAERFSVEQGILSLRLFAGFLLTLGVCFVAPATVEGKYVNVGPETCSVASCHPSSGVTFDVAPVIQVAVENVTQGTGPNLYSGGTLTVNSGDVLEIDWKYSNLGAANASTPVMWLPAGWTPTAGTINAPPISGWNTAWDAASGVSWNWSLTAAGATDDANTPDGWMIDFTGTAWEGGVQGIAADGVAQDQDGVAEQMGADARVTVSGSGPQYVHVSGSGKGFQNGGKKASKGSVDMMITLNVTAGADTTPPTVSSTSPTDGATGVTRDSAVTVNWNEDVDCTTVTTATVTMAPAVGWSRSSCAGSQAVFTPSGQAYGTAYTVTVGTGVQDLAGNPMSAAYDFGYATVVNQPPTFTSSAAPSVAENQTAVTTVTTSDPEGDTVTYALAGSGADEALFSITSGGVLTFDVAPDAENPGDANADNVYLVDVRADDGNGNTPVQNLSITVSNVNDAAPVISNAPSGPATEDTLFSFDFNLSDADGTGQTWSTLAGDTCGGTIVAGTGVYSFTPAGPTPPAGCDISVEVCDDGGLCDSRTTSIAITEVNDNPAAVGENYGTSENTPLNVAAPGVLGNDTDPEGEALTAVLDTGPANSQTFILNADGSFDYQPTTNYTGTDSFTYHAQDASGGSSGTVTVTIDVTAGADTTPPSDGASFTATPADSRADLSWDAATDDVGVDHYRVVFSTTATPATGCTDGTEVFNGAGTAASHTGLVNGTTYYYRVCAYDAAANVSTGLTASATPAAAGVNSTAAGTATATAGNAVIDVTAPYTDDDNGDNTLTVSWGQDGVDCSLGSQPLVHSASPYTWQITGLTNGTAYQVCVDYADADGVTGTDPQTLTGLTPRDYNPLIHSSASTGSAKWSADGGWGVPGGKYGEFTCATCHGRKTGNVKRVKTTLSAPNGVDQLPIEADPSPPAGGITFLDLRDGSADYGDDAGRGDTTQSEKICEACHSQNKYHNYDIAHNTGGTGHANGQDCMACHAHKEGFAAAGCDSCHGNPPTTSDTDGSTSTGLVHNPSPTGATSPASAGAHTAHAVSRGMTCNVCHDGNTMPTVSSTIQMGFAVDSGSWSSFSGSVISGSLDVPQDANLVNGYTFIASAAGTTVTKLNVTSPSCTVYCHGDWAGSAGANISPDWSGGATEAACGSCHGASAANAPTSGSHPQHAGSTGQAMACSSCHPTYVDTAHLDGDVTWDVSGLAGSAPVYRGAGSGSTGSIAPSATYGQCSGISCHDDGLGAEVVTPVWGTAVNDCSECHATQPATGAHAAHLGQAISPVIGCGNCHDGAVEATTAPAGHRDGDLDVYAATAGDLGYPQDVAKGGSPYGSCTTSYCHGDAMPYGSDINNDPNWADVSTGCGFCHGSPPSTGGHSGTEALTDCSGCHPDTMDGSGAVSTPANHINGTVEVSASCAGCHNGGGSGAYAVGPDSTHSTNTITGAPTCESCHFDAHGSRTTGTVGIAWDARTMGADYTADGMIYIRQYSGTETSEAQICWNCHDANGVSEWGTGPGRTYDFGMLHDGGGSYGSRTPQSDWTTAEWDSANFAYKSGAVASTHGTNAGSAGVDSLASISCTSCHDVHSAGNNGTAPAGSPYLRGSWKPTPYNEDGAPQSSTTYTAGGSAYSGTSAEGMPREYPGQTGMGGYWIDQNSGSPANGTYAEHAGLCTLCHGDGDTVEGEAADVTAIETLWSGHANSVSGGNGGGANIFRNSLRNGDGTWDGGFWMGAVNYTSPRDAKPYGGSLRNEDYGDGVAPLVANNPTAWTDYGWGASVDDATTDQNFHSFSCSKCHNPHASRLPKLMITNCLDVRHNTWDDQFTGDGNWSNWGTGLHYNTKEFAYSSTAQNCHRYVDSNADGTAEEAGWNSVTPW